MDFRPNPPLLDWLRTPRSVQFELLCAGYFSEEFWAQFAKAKEAQVAKAKEVARESE